MDRAVILRYHEIALKGFNRGWFEERLGINSRKLIQRSLGKSASVEVQKFQGRILIRTPWNDGVRTALTKVFGIANFSPMRMVPTDLESLKKAALEEYGTFVATHGAPKTFRVRTKRSQKALPEKSMEIDQVVGSAIRSAHPELVVDLEKADFTLGIEINREQSFVWTEKIQGPGGLPVGTNGHLLSLISGGLDSPVASIRIMKRGASLSFIHFYGAPFVGPEVLEKVEDLVRIVNRFQPEPKPLWIVPFGKIQERIALVTNPKLRTVLYRRMMIRISAEAAKRIKAQALVTGESLGQVASQTIENLRTIDEVADLPIIRPLIASDKEEIIQAAHAWGTYDTAIRPGVDCCTLFADRHPTIRSSISMVEEQEQRFSIDELVQEAISQAEPRSVG